MHNTSVVTTSLEITIMRNLGASEQQITAFTSAYRNHDFRALPQWMRRRFKRAYGPRKFQNQRCFRNGKTFKDFHSLERSWRA